MNTGKDEYAPDYKSDKPKRLSTIKEMSGSIHYGGRVVFEDGEAVVLTQEETIAHEHARLQSTVVEAAKAHRQSRAIGHASIRITSACRVCQDEKVFNAAVDALIAFEAEHKIGEIDA